MDLYKFKKIFLKSKKKIFCKKKNRKRKKKGEVPNNHKLEN